MKSQLIAIVAALLVVGCGESQPPEPPDLSIHEAVRRGNIEAVKQHLAAGTDVDAKDGRFGNRTPLFSAIYYGHKEIVELLLANGADVNVRSFGGLTPLNMADEQGEKEIADLLRKHGGKTLKELEAAGN